MLPIFLILYADDDGLYGADRYNSEDRYSGSQYDSGGAVSHYEQELFGDVDSYVDMFFGSDTGDRQDQKQAELYNGRADGYSGDVTIITTFYQEMYEPDYGF